eukprot:m.80006 g.80006  ORF g.80006 m.80006 type:complete len:2206 (-) comp8022_c1_seq1:60-6677(-)
MNPQAIMQAMRMAQMMGGQQQGGMGMGGGAGGAGNMAALAQSMQHMQMGQAQHAGGGMGALGGLGGLMALAQSARQMQQGMRGGGGGPAGGGGGMANLLNMAQAMGGQARQRTASISPQPMRETLHLTGWAEKQGAIVKNWKKRYFTLSSTALKYFASQADTAPKGTVLLANVQSASATSSSAAPVGLTLQTPGRTFLVRFDAPDVRDQWLEAVKARIAALRGGNRAPATAAADGPASAPTATAAAAPGAAAAAPALPENAAFDHKYAIARRQAVNAQLLRHAQGETGGGVMLVTGEAGAGVSVALTQFAKAFYFQKEGERVNFTKMCPGWHRIGVLACRACGVTKFSAGGSLFTTADESNLSAATAAGTARIRQGELCAGCSTPATLEWLVLGDDEVAQMIDNFALRPVPTDTIVLRCKTCQATAFPLTAQGPCVNYEGQIYSPTGQPMPNGNMPEWTAGFLHVLADCRARAPPLEHVPLRLTSADVEVLRGLPKAPLHKATVGTPNFYMAVANQSPLTYSATTRGILCRLGQVAEQLPPEGVNQFPANHDELRGRVYGGIKKTLKLSRSDSAVIVVDLGDTPLGDFTWLAMPIPEDTYVIIGARAGVGHEVVLQQLATSVGFSFTHYALPPLTPDEGKDLLSNIYSTITNAGWPDAAAAQAFVASRALNPLYIRALAGLAMVDKTAFGDLGKYPDNLGAVVDVVITRALDASPKAAPAVMTVLAAAQHTLAEADIVEAAASIEPGVTDKDVAAVLAGPLAAVIYPIDATIRRTWLISSFVGEAILQKLYATPEARAAAHGKLAAFHRSKGTNKHGEYEASAYHLDDYAFHLLRAGNLESAAKELQNPALCEARIRGGHAQELLADLEVLFSLPLQPSTLASLQRFVAFLGHNFAKLVSGTPWSTVAAGVVQSIPRELLQGELAAGAAIRSRTVRIFTSSTFDDLKVERDALMHDAYPRIRAWCEAKSLEFQVVDMRWGIRDESTNDHQTTAICMQEIAGCQQTSVGPNFVTFLSQRYGYRPFPDRIEAKTFDALLGHVTADDKALLKKWFLLDDNVVPPTYVLQPVSTHLPDFLNEANDDARKKARAAWWDDFERMSKALRAAARKAFASDAERLRPFEFSVTENEIRTGLLNVPKETRDNMCIWFKRNITDLDAHIANGDKRVGAFTDLVWGTNTVDPDAKRLLDTLRNTEVPAAMNPKNVHEYDVEFAPGVGIDPANSKHAAYIKKLVDDFEKVLVASISASLERQAKLGPLHEEIMQHLIFARDLVSRFGGRTALLNKIRSYLQSTESSSPLVITGDSGSGKSALAAALVGVAREELAAGRVSGCMGRDSGAVVARFVGLTAQSSDVSSLLGSLISQLSQLLAVPIQAPESVSDLKGYFLELLAKCGSAQPLVLILDGLDQISDKDFGRELDRWLPCSIPAGVKIILTMVPDRNARVFPVIRRHIYGQPGFETLFQQVGTLNDTEADEILTLWLAGDKRKLLPAQRKVILDGFKQCRSPLYLRLAYNESRTWASYTTDFKLPASVRDLIQVFFGRLMRVHGTKLVQHALMYITLARDGLSFVELEHLLSLDDDVLNDVFQYWEPPQRRLPPLLWVRLRRDLGEFLDEFGGQGSLLYRWTHLQFRTAVEETMLMRPAAPIVAGEELPSMASMKADDALRLATLLVDPPEALETKVAESAVEREMRKRCAEFWLGQWHAKPKPYTSPKGEKREADRAVPQQPALLDRITTVGTKNLNFAHPNIRRMRELPRHLALGGLKEQLAAELCSGPVLDFHIAPASEDPGELRTLFDVIGGMPAALRFFQQAITKAGQATDFTNGVAKNELLIHIDAIIDFLHQCNVQGGAAGNELFAQLLQARERILGKDNVSMAPLMTAQAMMAAGAGNAALAIDLAKRAGQLNAAAYGDQSEQYALGLVNLTRVCILANIAERALPALEQAIGVLQRLATTSSQASLAAAMATYGEIMLKSGQNERALKMLQPALPLMEKVKGPDHQDTAAVMNNLSAAYQATGKLQQAMELQARCINVRQLRLGGRHPLVGHSMNNMGAIYLSVGHVTEAVPLFERALEIAKLSDTIEKDDDIGTAINNLGACYQRQGRLPDAARLFEEGLANLRRSRTANPRSLAQSMQNLAGVLLDMRQLDRAETLFRESLPLFERHYGPTEPETGMSYEGIAVCLQLQGRMQESMPYVQRTQQIQAMHGHG